MAAAIKAVDASYHRQHIGNIKGIKLVNRLNANDSFRKIIVFTVMQISA
jgi:hypothetical protein